MEKVRIGRITGKTEITPAFINGEKTDAWWDAYEEGYADAIRDVQLRVPVAMEYLNRRKDASR